MITPRRHNYLFGNTMELKLDRTTFTENTTIGTLYVNGKQECFILEDRDRGLDDSMSLDQINKMKVYGKTAIPSGRYEVLITMSNRFKRELPLVTPVKGYEGIRIHPGNTAADTLGCLLPGRKKSVDSVSESTLAFNALFEKLKAAKAAGERIFLTITK